MKTTSIVMIAVAAVTVFFTLRPRLLRAPMWRATVTPLASIIGSGFLVVGPILAHAAGLWAWLAMLGLCAAAYLFGSAIRRNIRTVEPMLEEGGHPRTVALLERASDVALAFSYFISVAYYLSLLASFALRAGGVIDATATRWVSSAVLLALGVLGLFRGLSALENVEEGAVGIKLGMIGGLLAALAVSAVVALSGGTFALRGMEHPRGLNEIQILLGLVIVVQGFETSRYLGAAYDRPTRVRTMRYAQLLSSAIYLAFVLLITPFFTGRLPAQGGETRIIDMLAPLGIAVAPLIIVAALASQLSAAVADMNGAGGLVATTTGQRVSMRTGFVATVAVALTITWIADIYEIIVYASKAFVVYYGLQCSLAAFVAARPGTQRNRALAGLYGAGAALAVTVVLFGVPAEGG